MKKRKVISIITALGLMASAVPSALAASSKYHTTRRDSYGYEYYIDSYDNKIYGDFNVDLREINKKMDISILYLIKTFVELISLLPIQKNKF